MCVTPAKLPERSMCFVGRLGPEGAVKTDPAMIRGGPVGRVVGRRYVVSVWGSIFACLDPVATDGGGVGVRYVETAPCVGHRGVTDVVVVR